MAQPLRENGSYEPEGDRPRFTSLPGGGNRAGAPDSTRENLKLMKPNPMDEGTNDVRSNLRSLEGGGNKTDGGNTAARPELRLLKNAEDEEKPATKPPKGFIKDVTVDPGSTKNKNFVQRNWKKVGIGGALAGGGIGALFGLSTLILPLKVTALVSELETRFQAAPQAALQKATDNAVNEYIAKYLLPGINTKLCTTTVEPTCVGDIGGKSPISRLYQAWRQNKIETKLAKDYGIVFGRDNRGNLYMAVNGKDELTNDDLLKVMHGEASIFDVGNQTTVGTAGAELRSSFKDMSLFDRIFFRFKALRLLRLKYGVIPCSMACDFFDKFTATIAEKKLAAQAEFVRYVISPISPEYGILLQCLLSPDQAFCSQALDKIQNPSTDGSLDDAALTPFQQNLQKDLEAYAADEANSMVDLASAVNDANSIADKGFTEFIVERALTAIFGDTIGKLGAKAVPVIGWVLLASQVISLANKLGPFIRFMGNAINSAAAVKLLMDYSSVSAETKSGHVDPTELGSYVQSLSTNMNGASTDISDATSTPLFNAIIGNGASNTTSSYKCNDGSSVPSGQLVCPEERLDRGNGVADAITSGVNAIPGLTGLADIINQVNNLIGDLVGGAMNVACHAADLLPPGSACSNALKTAGQYIGQFASWFVNLLLPSPFSSSMSGGRTFDMMAAGADVANNQTCQVELGCARLNNQQIASIRNQAVTSEKTAFDQQPIFARMFSTSSPYSLVSQLAVTMPTTLPQAAARFGNMIGNPLHTLASAFADIFPSNKAFADIVPIDDPFGVVQYGYDQSQVPTNPAAYWDQHCQGNFGPDWMNNLPQDPNTGQPLATKPEPCLLLQSMAQSAGTFFDNSLAPPNSANADPTAP